MKTQDLSEVVKSLPPKLPLKPPVSVPSWGIDKLASKALWLGTVGDARNPPSDCA
jgi:hypothetical protein